MQDHTNHPESRIYRLEHSTLHRATDDKSCALFLGSQLGRTARGRGNRDEMKPTVAYEPKVGG